jgi:hypothetical protein
MPIESPNSASLGKTIESTHLYVSAKHRAISETVDFQNCLVLLPTSELPQH